MSKKTKKSSSNNSFKIVILFSLLAIFAFILVSFQQNIAASGAYLLGIDSPQPSSFTKSDRLISPTKIPLKTPRK